MAPVELLSQHREYEHNNEEDLEHLVPSRKDREGGAGENRILPDEGEQPDGGHAPRHEEKPEEPHAPGLGLVAVDARGEAEREEHGAQPDGDELDAPPTAEPVPGPAFYGDEKQHFGGVNAHENGGDEQRLVVQGAS